MICWAPEMSQVAVRVTVMAPCPARSESSRRLIFPLAPGLSSQQDLKLAAALEPHVVARDRADVLHVDFARVAADDVTRSLERPAGRHDRGPAGRPQSDEHALPLELGRSEPVESHLVELGRQRTVGRDDLAAALEHEAAQVGADRGGSARIDDAIHLDGRSFARLSLPRLHFR